LSSLNRETQARLQSINRFLEDICGYSRWLSDFLHEAGLSEDEIAWLRLITWIPIWPGCSGVGDREWRRSCPPNAATSSSAAMVWTARR